MLVVMFEMYVESRGDAARSLISNVLRTRGILVAGQPGTSTPAGEAHHPKHSTKSPRYHNGKVL